MTWTRGWAVAVALAGGAPLAVADGAPPALGVPDAQPAPVGSAPAPGTETRSGGEARGRAAEPGAGGADGARADEELAAAATAGEVIVVTGTRSEAPLRAAPVATEVIDRRQLEASGVRTLAAALALRPGLWIDRGVAGTQGVSIHGLAPQYTLVLVDGARQIGRTGGYLDLDRFGVADVEQVEIVRGPGSALYGADALGGVVNIVTRAPRDGLALEALGQLDDRRAGDARGRVTIGSGGLAAAITGAYRRGPEVRRADDPAAQMAPDATIIDGYDDRSVSARVTDRRAERWRLDATASYAYRHLRGVDAGATGAVFDRQNLVETASARGAARYAADRTSVELDAGISGYRDQYRNDQRGADALDVYEETRERLIDGAAQVAHHVGPHHVRVGTELLRESLEAARLSAPGRRTRGALFVQDEWRVGADAALLVVPAARLDVDSQFGNHATPKLAARWQLDGLVLRASVGMGYRAPDFKELQLHFQNPGVGYVVDGNPALGPETSRSVSGGAEWQARPGLWLAASGFYDDLHGLIATVTLPDDGTGVLRFGYANVGRARTAGVELYALIGQGRGTLELGYALTRGRDFELDRALEGVPAHRATATARWRDPARGLEGFLAAVATGHRPYYLSEDPQRATLTARRVELRARVAASLGGGVSAFVGGDNLLDAGDAALDRLSPRTLYAGVELHL